MVKIGTIFYVNNEITDPILSKFKNIDIEIFEYLDNYNVIIGWVDESSKQTIRVSFSLEEIDYLFKNRIWINKKIENRKQKIKKLKNINGY